MTLFEKRSDVGGLWTFSDDPSVTSAMACKCRPQFQHVKADQADRVQGQSRRLANS